MNADELISFLRHGEGTSTEFKVDFPSNAHSLAKEMAALANSGGGVLLLGVDDDGTPKGIADPHRAADRLAGIARNCGLSVLPEIDKFQVSKNIVIVYARVFPCPPCFCEGKIYHRVGSLSVECTSADQLNRILANKTLPVEPAQQPSNPQRGRWSGYWFVNVGDGPTRCWEDCLRYGFVSAGQGQQYSKSISQLRIGDKVFAYINKFGYVGRGEVNAAAVMVNQFIVRGTSRKLLELPLTEPNIAANAGNKWLSEWVVGITWQKTFRREEAKFLKGVPVYRNIVCRLRHAETIAFLEQEFQLTRR
jgi:hypothetical protein